MQYASDITHAPQHIDTLIIGQGLAGSLLAYQLMQHGQKIVILGDEEAPSASRVAAGLFNPITGQRCVLQANAAAIISAARCYYRQLEKQFHQDFFHAKPLLRILQSHNEQQRINKRYDDPAYAPFLGSHIDQLAGISAPYGLSEQQQTGYLNTNALLDALRDYFRQQQCYIAAHFAYDALSLADTGITWRNIHARRIIFCQGFMDQNNPWFHYLPFQPAKGEILTFQSKALLPDHIINAGKWLLPLHDGTYKTGATYSHDLSNNKPSAQGKAECLQGLQKLLDSPIDIQITQHQAGIRPNTLDKNPFIGFHPEHPQLGIFNGFGSKGSMLIPYYTHAFAQHINTKAPIPKEADIQRIPRAQNVPRSTQNKRIALTDRVHHALQAHLKPNSIAIDATVGNGHDSLFLAQSIDATGHIYGFDIQAQAINATRTRLQQAQKADHTTLICSGHQHMLKHIPRTFHAKVDIILFNLGYLPHSDKACITQTDTTIQALEAATQLIAIHGRISILAYPGHRGGDQETNAIKIWLESLATQHFHTITHQALHPTSYSPIWFEIIRISFSE